MTSKPIKHGLLLIALACLNSTAHSSNLNDLSTKLDSTRKKITDLKKYDKSLSQKALSLTSALKALEKDMSDTRRNIFDINENISTNRQQIKYASLEIEAIERKIDNNKAIFHQQLSSILYKYNNKNITRAYFNKDSDLSRHHGYLYRVAFYTHKKSINENVASIFNKNSFIAKHEQLNKGLLSRQHELLQAQDKLEVLKGDKGKTLLQINKLSKDNNDLIKLLSKDESELQTRLQSIRTNSYRKNNFAINDGVYSINTGEFLYPVKQTQSTLELNTPIIKVKEGTPIRTISSGKVVFANWLKGFGLLIIVDHGSGLMSLYGHNQTLLKEVNDIVTKGDTISLSGNSGGNDTPSLYFELRGNGQPIKIINKWFKV